MNASNGIITIFAGSASRPFAQKMCDYLGVELGKSTTHVFSEGGIYVRADESIRNKDVYIVQSIGKDPNNAFTELIFWIDAFKRASANSITAIIPYFGYAKADKKDEPRVSIRARVCADCIEMCGADRVITMDLHADQIQGFFNVPVDHLYASSVFIPYIQSLNLEDLVIATPDVGGAKRANSYAKYLGVPLVICHKQRAKANVVATMTIIGNVVDKDVIIIDDMVDTAGTITKAAELMKENGARSVRALASHAIMSDPATQRVNDSPLTEMIFTNSIPYTKDSNKCTIISVARLFADTIRRVQTNESISSQYVFK